MQRPCHGMRRGSAGGPNNEYNRIRMSHEEAKLFVGGLPEATTRADLARLFAASGPVFGVKLVTDRRTGRSKGFAFVEMATAADAQAAMKKFDGYRLGDRRIFITPARPQEKRDVSAPPGPASRPVPPGAAGFVERRTGKDRRAAPSEAAAKPPVKPAAKPPFKPAPKPAAKPVERPAGYGPGFTRDRWKKPGRTRR